MKRFPILNAGPYGTMTDQAIIQEKLVHLKTLAPKGYALALHVKFTAPTFLLQTYDRKWLDYYSQNSFVISDPIVRWGFENRGALLWADLVDEDDAGVIQAASDHGLKHGVVAAVENENGFSIGGFARDDRPYTAEEAEALRAFLDEIHNLTDQMKELSPETAEQLRELSIHYTHPSHS